MSTKTIARARGWVLTLAALALGCGGDDWHDAALRTDCGQNGQACCDDLACYNGGRCLAGTTGRLCRDPERRQRNECRSDNDCGLSEQCGGAQSCLEERVCFLCQAAFAGATARLGERCDNNMNCTTGLCLGNQCAAPCRYGTAGDAYCRGLPNGATSYCATLQAIYVGAATPTSTTVSVCLPRCADDGTCPAGKVCVQNDEPLLNRVTPTCAFPRP